MMYSIMMFISDVSMREMCAVLRKMYTCCALYFRQLGYILIIYCVLRQARESMLKVDRLFFAASFFVTIRPNQLSSKFLIAFGRLLTQAKHAA